MAEGGGTMSRAAPKDNGQEARRLVAAAYIAGRPERQRANAAIVVALWTDGGGDYDMEIRRAVVAAIVTRWPGIDRMYTAKVVRDLCRGTCAPSAGWRTRLEALGGAS